MLLAVLFLEFWKRRQFVLEHEWDVLGYEEAEVCTGGIENIIENMHTVYFNTMYNRRVIFPLHLDDLCLFCVFCHC